MPPRHAAHFMLVLAAAMGLAAMGLAALAGGCGPGPADPPALTVDEQLQHAIDERGLEPLAAPPAGAPAKIELGQALFFDKVLSGNRDTSCASCHHPRKMTGDDRPLSVGTGAVVDGQHRRLGPRRTLTARNSPEIFNRGVAQWRTQFWDMRVRTTAGGALLTPAGSRLPDGVDGVLAAQAMFPVTGRDEMRGLRSDAAGPGSTNELAAIVDGLLNQIWDGLMDRLLAIDEYRRMFTAAYPDTDAQALGFEHAANAIAAFEVDAFGYNDSAWDRYVGGDDQALSAAQKRGAVLFYGSAGCAQCHSGVLFSDQKAHNLAVPQFGPGKHPDEPLDRGYGRVSNDPAFDFAFRTPTLRNVAATAPYMHDGAYDTLEATIDHHLHPARRLRAFGPDDLPSRLADQLHNGAEQRARMLETLDPRLVDGPELSDAQIDDVIAFLGALSSTDADASIQAVPESVPSGLPLD